ncbi:MAG: CSLREA domain-containing protein, partial [Gammaproteobacteria bacterium]|nr:CSLREA domain-containing protein [Gammaproteobacteria bacterium]
MSSRLLMMIACAVLLVGLLPVQTQAATFTVTKTADTNDGTCDADCSLREAIVAANTSGGSDTVSVPAGTYNLSITGTGENAAATGDLDISDTLTLTGAGAASTIIDG